MLHFDKIIAFLMSDKVIDILFFQSNLENKMMYANRILNIYLENLIPKAEEDESLFCFVKLKFIFIINRFLQFYKLFFRKNFKQYVFL